MPSPRDAFLTWNRRLHYYLGLYFLFFTWLFVFTGLLLNHPLWRFAEFWPNRMQSTSEHQIEMTSEVSDLERARHLMQQLGITGEIQWPVTQPLNGPFTFQITRPGMIVDVKADPRSGHATLQQTRLNTWGVMHVLHTFTGVPANDSRQRRDWMVTTAWALSMDAVAAGLIVMVLSSYIMWYRLKPKRRPGIVALILGFATCGLFVAGLGWLG